MTAMTSRSPGNAVQAAFVSLLRADPTIAGLLASIAGVDPLTPAVIDQPAEGQTYPYVVVGDHLSIADNDHTSFGREGTENLHIWTKARSNKPGQEIADACIGVLDHQVRALSDALAAEGFRCVSVRAEFDQALRDPDPQVRHHVVRFRVQTQQTS